MTTNETPAHNETETSTEDRAEAIAYPPLRLKLKDYFHPDCGDAYYFAWAASRLHVGIRIENMADTEGNMCVEVTLYETVPTVECRDVDAWWPVPRGWEPSRAEPLCDDDLWDALHDARWETDQARAYMLRVRHHPGCCAASRRHSPVTRQEWFVDFSELELTGDLDYHSFPYQELHSPAGVRNERGHR